MSLLAKILIVLLTISSIFLCGIVVTYVANADNYKQKNEILMTDLAATKEREKSAKRQLNENIAKTDRQAKGLKDEIASLKIEISKVKNDLKDAEREKASLLQKVDSWTSITKDFYQTTDKQGQLLKNTLEELNRVQAGQIKQKKELDEISAELLEKVVIIETLEREKKRLLEQKTELQNRLNQFLLSSGKVATEVGPVTLEKDVVKLVGVPVRDIDLKGLVTAVDLKNSMASISISAADGVKEGMIFHVTRGDEFICDILILDIDAEKAVGVLQLVQQGQQPKIGDNVSTSF